MRGVASSPQCCDRARAGRVCLPVPVATDACDGWAMPCVCTLWHHPPRCEDDECDGWRTNGSWHHSTPLAVVGAATVAARPEERRPGTVSVRGSPGARPWGRRNECERREACG